MKDRDEIKEFLKDNIFYEYYDSITPGSYDYRAADLQDNVNESTEKAIKIYQNLLLTNNPKVAERLTLSIIGYEKVNLPQEVTIEELYQLAEKEFNESGLTDLDNYDLNDTNGVKELVELDLHYHGVYDESFDNEYNFDDEYRYKKYLNIYRNKITELYFKYLQSIGLIKNLMYYNGKYRIIRFN